MKRCVLKSEFGKGYRIFWYKHLETTDENIKDYIKIYVNEKDKEFLMICHISKIITVPDNEVLEKQKKKVREVTYNSVEPNNIEATEILAKKIIAKRLV